MISLLEADRGLEDCLELLCSVRLRNHRPVYLDAGKLLDLALLLRNCIVADLIENKKVSSNLEEATLTRYTSQFLALWFCFCTSVST